MAFQVSSTCAERRGSLDERSAATRDDNHSSCSLSPSFPSTFCSCQLFKVGHHAAAGSEHSFLTLGSRATNVAREKGTEEHLKEVGEASKDRQTWRRHVAQAMQSLGKHDRVAEDIALLTQRHGIDVETSNHLRHWLPKNPDLLDGRTENMGTWSADGKSISLWGSVRSSVKEGNSWIGHRVKRMERWLRKT